MSARVVSVIGVDPGPTTGIAFIDYIDGRIAGSMRLQVDGMSAVVALEAILARYYSNPEVVVKRAAGVEEFVTGKSAGTRGDAATVTRQLELQLTEKLQLWNYHVKIRKMADIAGWASDKRLERSGLLGPPEMRHANDGARHGLYRAVHDLYMPDPLR